MVSAMPLNPDSKFVRHLLELLSALLFVLLYDFLKRFLP